MTVLIHVLGKGTAAHDTDLLIDFAAATNRRNTHDADLITGKLIAGITDHCSDAAAAFVDYPPEARYPDMWLSGNDRSVSRFGFG